MKGDSVLYLFCTVCVYYSDKMYIYIYIYVFVLLTIFFSLTNYCGECNCQVQQIIFFLAHGSPEFLCVEVVSKHEGKTNSEPQTILLGCVAIR